MTQQIFTPAKEGDSIFHYSMFGDQRTDVAIPPNQELEFLIYNGKGGLKFDIEIGLLLDNDSHRRIRSTRNRLDFNTNAGFGWELPIASDLDINNPVLPPVFPSGGGGPSVFSLEKLTIKLFQPRQENPIKIWNFENESARGERTLVFPETFVNGSHVFVDPEIMKKTGWWKCKVTHHAQLPAHIIFWTKSFLHPANIKETILPYRWLNHAFQNVMSILTPRATIKGHNISAGLLEELSHAIHADPITFEDNIEEIVSHMELVSIATKALNGSDMKSIMEKEKDRMAQLTADQLLFLSSQIPGATLQNVLPKLFEAWDQQIALINNDDIVIKITPLFANPTIEFSKTIVSGDIIFGNHPIILIKFSKSGYHSCYVNLDYQVKNLNVFEKKLLKVFSGDKYKLLYGLNELITKTIMANNKLMDKYLRLALGKAAGKYEFVDGYRAVHEGWAVSHYEINLPDPSHVPITGGHRGHHDHHVPFGEGGPIAERERGEHVEPVPTNPGFGTFPEDFQVADGVALERLDKIKTLVVIMMENRSFDHFLGELCRSLPIPGDNYIGFPQDFTNPKSGNFAGPIPVIKASGLAFKDVLVTPISPEHEHDHVLNQISDGIGTVEKMGAMQGFTIDVMNRINERGISNFESPQVVMSYYEKAQLPFYYFLAENFKVLDQWFAAHPGPTWPNRIAMTTGKLIGLRNFDMMKDDRISGNPQFLIL